MIEEFTELTSYSDKQHGQRPGDAEIQWCSGKEKGSVVARVWVRKRMAGVETGWAGKFVKG